MEKKKEHKKFLKNRFIARWWIVFSLFAIAAAVYAAVAFPLWAIILMGCTALALFVVCIIKTAVLRFKLDDKGITFPISVTKKRFFAYNDIDSVQIRCITGYTKNTVYMIRLTCSLFALDIKTRKDVVDEINRLSKDSYRLQMMLAESLKDAEAS